MKLVKLGWLLPIGAGAAGAWWLLRRPVEEDVPSEAPGRTVSTGLQGGGAFEGDAGGFEVPPTYAPDVAVEEPAGRVFEPAEMFAPGGDPYSGRPYQLPGKEGLRGPRTLIDRHDPPKPRRGGRRRRPEPKGGVKLPTRRGGRPARNRRNRPKPKRSRR